MIFSELFERFVREAPVTVMARAAMERALAPEALDALFSDRAEQQCGNRPIVNAQIGPS